MYCVRPDRQKKRIVWGKLAIYPEYRFLAIQGSNDMIFV